MIGWHHGIYGHEFEQASGIDDRQGSLACCSPWGHKELGMTELNVYSFRNPSTNIIFVLTLCSALVQMLRIYQKTNQTWLLSLWTFCSSGE